METIRILNAHQKAEALLMRGRGSGGYYLDGGILWDCEVTCVAQAPDDVDAWEDFRDWNDIPCYDSPWDWENTNSWNDPMYDGAYGSGGVSAAADDASRDIENGQRILSEIENGNVPITATPNALEVIRTLGSTAAYQSVVNTVEKIGMDLYQVRNLGKALGGVGASVCFGVAVYDVMKDDATPQEIIELVGATAGLVGLFFTGPVGLCLGGASLGIAIYSFCSETYTQNSNGNY